MGEAWSDAYAAFFSGSPFVGAYVQEGDGFVRSLENDTTYANYCSVDYQGVCDPHINGMIWSATLWDLHRSYRARYGEGPGALECEKLLIDGMKLTPCPPDFLDARNAILQADVNRSGGANQGLIWQTFAHRGMGQSASTTGSTDTSPVAAFDLPAAEAQAIKRLERRTFEAAIVRLRWG